MVDTHSNREDNRVNNARKAWPKTITTANKHKNKLASEVNEQSLFKWK